MQSQIRIPGERYLRIVPRSSDMKFHKIWSSGCGKMASNKQTYAQHGDYMLPRIFQGAKPKAKDVNSCPVFIVHFLL